MRRDVHISPFRRELGWLNVKARRQYFLAIVILKILNGSAPSYLGNLFQRAPAPSRPSRRQVANTFSMPNHRTSCLHNSFVFTGMYLWHSLPAEVTASLTLSSFKSKLYAHLFDQELL